MKFFLFFISVFFAFHSSSQTSFDIHISTENYTLINGDTPCIDNNNNYYIPYNSLTQYPNGDYIGKIIKLNEYGDLIDTYSLPELEDSDISFAGSSLLINDTLFFIGLRRYYDNNNAVLMKFDLDLNLIDSTEIFLSDTLQLDGFSGFEYINDNLYILASCGHFNSPGFFSGLNGILFYKTDKSFQNTTYTYHIDSNEFVFPYDFTHTMNNELIVTCLDWKYNINVNPRSFIQFGSFNTNLIPISSSEISNNDLWSHTDIERYQDSLFLVSGSQFVANATDPYDYNEDLAVYKINSALEILDSVFITHPYNIDTLDNTCSKCLDYYDDDNIYFASNKNIETIFYLTNHPSWIRLVKLDADLNIIWEKFYGGDRVNIIKGIKATPDGGCIMLCDFYDYEAYPDFFKTDLRIIKVDSDGLVTGIPEEGGLVIKSLLLYPNPSSGHVSIETALRDYSIQFFDGGGRLVWTSSKLSGNQEMDLSHLANGIYLYTVVDDDGRKLDDGKLVMER